MTNELTEIIGYLVFFWFAGYGFGLLFRLIRNIVERASRP